MERTCEDQQAAYLDGDPHAAEHLSTCPSCVRDQSGFEEIKSLLDDESTWVEPPAGLEDRIVAATRPDQLRARRAEGAWPGRRTSRMLWLAAAACVASGLIGAGAVKFVDRQPSFPQHVALAGTALAPQASAVAHIRTTPLGLEIRLDVTGLPTTRPGHFYQAWLKGPSGLVPIGTFHTGNGEIILWSGVALDTHPTLTVTFQADNGDAASSGQRVLLGTLKR
jgi:hypothetical protein